MAPIRIAIVGLGKIAHDQHIPAIAGDPAFALAATVCLSSARVAGVPHFDDIATLAAAGLDIDAIALCTPPQVRRPLAATALRHGLHVLLEKPPCATLAEVAALDDEAAARGLTLFAAWHSRHAPAVEPARAWLAARTIRSVAVTWREDVRVWHPGQSWIWEPGGFGVFDPGINALSVLTHILPRPIFVTGATLSVPANRAAPIAAVLAFTDDLGTPISADFDFREPGEPRWDIVVETDDGTLRLSEGGAALTLPMATERAAKREYPALYARFADLIATRRRDVDVTPLRLVADAFLCARRETVAPFHD